METMSGLGQQDPPPIYSSVLGGCFLGGDSDVRVPGREGKCWESPDNQVGFSFLLSSSEAAVFLLPQALGVVLRDCGGSGGQQFE